MSNRFHKLRCKQYHLTVIQKELNYDLITILQDLQWVKCDHGVMDSAGLPHVSGGVDSCRSSLKGWSLVIITSKTIWPPWCQWLTQCWNFPGPPVFCTATCQGVTRKLCLRPANCFFHVFCCFLLNNVHVDVLTCVIFQSWWRGVGWANDVRVDVLTCVVFRSSWVSC